MLLNAAVRPGGESRCGAIAAIPGLYEGYAYRFGGRAVRSHSWLSRNYRATRRRPGFRSSRRPANLLGQKWTPTRSRRPPKTTHGKFYTFADADRLLADLPAGRRVPIENLPPIPIWNRWWLLAAFLSCITTEWILRKRKGCFKGWRLGMRYASVIAKNHVASTPARLASPRRCRVLDRGDGDRRRARARHGRLLVAIQRLRPANHGDRRLFCAAMAWAAYRWWYLPRQHRLRPIVVARQVESHFPQLYDSLASAIEFLGQSEHDATAGSAQLRRLVIADAQNKIEALPLNEVVDRAPLRKAAVALTVAAVAAGTLPRGGSRRSTNGTRPSGQRRSAALQWPRQHRLVFREVPDRLAAGQTFEVELIDECRPASR